MSHKCPDCGYGCQNFNEQHTHACKPFTIKDIDLNHEKDTEKYTENPFHKFARMEDMAEAEKHMASCDDPECPKCHDFKTGDIPE